MRCILIFSLCWLTPLAGIVDRNEALFNSIAQDSLEKNLAFYQLFPDHPLGDQALLRAAQLIGTNDAASLKELALCFQTQVKRALSHKQIVLIEKLAAHLPNRRLEGYTVASLEQVYALADDQVDLGKALIFSQHDDQEQALSLAQEYSAKLDLMALHVLALLPVNSGYMEKIIALNYFIFELMHFRFPPQSQFAKDIDRYTFLPSVMDQHLGVCLGVTALYYALAQRVDLPLEIAAPPGHIFLRYNTGDGVINIETTARGVHVPTEHYLGMNTHTLPLRSVKEIVSMTHVNQASVLLQHRRFEEAACAYKKALAMAPGDLLTRELLGYALVLSGQETEGRSILEQIAYETPNHAVKRHVLAEDYLKGKVNKEGIYTVFQEVNEERVSILQKIEQLKAILGLYPNFRDGLVQIAVCYLQLNRLKEAIAYLEKYHQLDATDPNVEYYLAILYAQSHDFNRSVLHAQNAQNLVEEFHFFPKALRELRLKLRETVL